MVDEIKRRQSEAPMLFYHRMLQKHVKQQAFLNAGKTYRRRLFLGANRCGKTTASRHEALAHVYGYRYWEIPGLRLKNGDLPPREEIPPQHWVRRTDGIPIRVPNVGMILSGLPRQRGIGQNIFPGLLEVLPVALRSGRLHVLKGAQGVPDYMVFPNGSKILFASEEQDDMSFEGFVLDWAGVDEPCSQSKYSALWARLMDYCGSIWFTMTPLGVKSAWLYQSMYLDPPKDVFVVEVQQRDNPGLTEEQIRAFEENGEYTERERQARLYGRFEFLGDRVFESFNPEVHVIPGFMPPKEWVHGCTVDPHHKRPSFVVWWAYDPTTKTRHYYREWPTVKEFGPFHKLLKGGLPLRDLAALVVAAEGPVRARVRVCDPRFGKAEHQRHGYHETSWVTLMEQYGLHFDANVPNTGSIEYGVGVIEDRLRYDKNFPISPTNHPRIYIHSACENVATAFMNFAYTDVEDAVKGLYRKVSEEFKDPIDAVRYTELYPVPCTESEIAGLQRFSEQDLRRENEY